MKGTSFEEKAQNAESKRICQNEDIDVFINQKMEFIPSTKECVLIGYVVIYLKISRSNYICNFSIR